nr:hypothetical protein [Streptomyces ruber]
MDLDEVIEAEGGEGGDEREPAGADVEDVEDIEDVAGEELADGIGVDRVGQEIEEAVRANVRP